MKILTLTTLYPNSEQYRHGIFIENRLLHLIEQYPDVQLKVIAPVPYFPSCLSFISGLFGSYGKYSKVPLYEQRHGVDIYHPRYLVIPKLGMNLTPYFLYRSLKKAVKRLVDSGYGFDLIDAHYFYPDGVAATKLANELDKPIIVTARGSDITLLATYLKPQEKIKKTLKNISSGIGVCQALVDEMKRLQPKHKPLQAIRNGVDLELFKPSTDRGKLRSKLDFSHFTLLMVGNLVELKGHRLVIKALKKLSNINLVIIGEGELRNELEQQVVSEHLQGKVRFIGGLKQSQLPDFYAAADCLVLASSREGWANVLLESMACGTPVVATKVWGTPEVVSKPEAGLLIHRDVDSIVQGIELFMKNDIDRSKTRQYAQEFSWSATSTAQYELFDECIAKHNTLGIKNDR